MKNFIYSLIVLIGISYIYLIFYVSLKPIEIKEEPVLNDIEYSYFAGKERKMIRVSDMFYKVDSLNCEVSKDYILKRKK